MRWCGHRTSTLSAMIDIRRIAVSEGGKKPEAARVPDGEAEDRILEIAELAHALKADGFPEPEIFKRIARVHQPEPQIHSFPLGGDPLLYYLRDYLSAHYPGYLKIDWQMFRCALTLAELWAELYAERLTASSWPPADMLSKPWSIRRYAGYAGVMRSATSKPEDFAQLSGNLGDVDVLIAEASKHPYGSESARAYRRMKVRAVPGDILHGYSTGARGWKAGMGTAGIALVRDGRSIDHVETRYN
jgi:hypothetical protein